MKFRDLFQYLALHFLIRCHFLEPTSCYSLKIATATLLMKTELMLKSKDSIFDLNFNLISKWKSALIGFNLK